MNTIGDYQLQMGVRKGIGSGAADLLRVSDAQKTGRSAYVDNITSTSLQATTPRAPSSEFRRELCIGGSEYSESGVSSLSVPRFWSVGAVRCPVNTQQSGLSFSGSAFFWLSGGGQSQVSFLGIGVEVASRRGRSGVALPRIVGGASQFFGSCCTIRENSPRSCNRKTGKLESEHAIYRKRQVIGSQFGIRSRRSSVGYRRGH